MIAPTQIRKPENWQDFEKLCTKLWGEIWKCQDSIKRNGRIGQEQHGVDIYGIPLGSKGYYGIQCKGKNDYANSTLTIKEIDSEIEKAKYFKPQLKQLIFATTASKDVRIEEYVRCKNMEHIDSGLFEVDIFAWEDIVSKLEEYRSTWNWYVNNCMYNDVCDVKVSFLQGNSIVIHPEYMRKHISYQQTIMPSNLFLTQLQVPTIFMEPKEYDGRWSDISIKVENIGSTTIEDYVLKVRFENVIEDVKTDVHFCNNLLMNAVVRESINQRELDNQEVFFSSEYSNGLECRPKKTVLVEHDTKIFNISILPILTEGDTVLYWEFLSRSYSKTGELPIHIEAKYFEKEVIETIPYGDPIPDDRFEITYMISKEDIYA